MNYEIQAEKDYNEILDLFELTDIKYTDEKDADDYIKLYANIKNYNGEYDSVFYKLVKNYERIETNKYIKYTDYGYICINNEPDWIIVEVYIETDPNTIYEKTLIPIEDLSKNENLVDDYDEIEDDGNYDAPYIPNQEPITYKGFDIYKGNDEYDNETYYIFFEDEPLPEPGYEDMSTNTLEQAKEWCDNYYEDEDIEIECKDSFNLKNKKDLKEGTYSTIIDDENIISKCEQYIASILRLTDSDVNISELKYISDVTHGNNFLLNMNLDEYAIIDRVNDRDYPMLDKALDEEVMVYSVDVDIIDSNDLNSYNCYITLENVDSDSFIEEDDYEDELNKLEKQIEKELFDHRYEIIEFIETHVSYSD